MQVLLQVLVILTMYTLEGFLSYFFIFFRKLVCKILCCDAGARLEHFLGGGGHAGALPPNGVAASDQNKS